MSEQDQNYTPPRTATRAPVEKLVKLQFDDSLDLFEGTCVNISIGGMFVTSKEMRPKGSLVRFEIVLDEQRSIRGLGEVVWMRSREGGGEKQNGIGVKFRFLEQRERQLIFKLVSQHIKDRLTQQAPPPLPPEGDDDEPVQLPIFTPPPEPAAPAGEALPALDDLLLEPDDEESEAEETSAEPGTHGGLFDTPSSEPSPAAGDDLPAAVPSWEQGAADESWEEEPEPALYHEPLQRRRSLPVLALVAAALVVAVGAVYLFKAGFFGDDDEASATPPANPMASPAAEATPPPPPELSPPPPPQPPPPPETSEVPPQPSPFFSRLVDISWDRESRGLRLILAADGRIPEGRYRHFRLDGGNPREVVRFLGVREKFARTEIPVGEGGIERIRVGFHEKRRGNELHVVVDLANPAFEMLEVRPAGNKLELLIGQP